MRERVIALHGEFSMRSSPQQGVRISVRLPLQPAP
jgi:signal transduction histidine kinase